MRTFLKKVAAAALAVVLAASLCGCDKGYIMTVDGMDIRNGVYLSYLSNAYSMALTAYKDQNADDDDDTPADSMASEKITITEETIDGKNGSQWIKDETIKLIRQFVATQRKCAELGIALTDDETKEINSDITELWENGGDYFQYLYGYPSMGEYYESRGIGQESMREILRVNKLKEKLFLYYYGEDGEFEVSQSEIDEYLKENYAVAKLLYFGYTDASGKKLEEDDEKKEVKDKAQGYVDRINSGDAPIDVFYDYDLAKAKESAEAKAEKEYDKDNEEGLTKEEWIDKQVEAADIKKAESADDLDSFISKESSNLDEKLTEYIFNASIDGKATLFETDGGVYLVIKDDVTKKTTWKEKNNLAHLNAIKGDDFTNMLDLFGQNYEVVADESLVNKKYGPETLNT